MTQKLLSLAMATIPALLAMCCAAGYAATADAAKTPVYGVVEIAFDGPACTPKDRPAVDVELSVLFAHENGRDRVRVQGFWDGDGKGGSSGGVYKVRFCPTLPGTWTLAEVKSNQASLAGQKQGQAVLAEASSLHGFWVPGGEGNRWFVRSDGSHQYIVGNTHYVMLSRPNAQEATTESIRADVEANAPYFNKIRTTLKAFRPPNASLAASTFFTPAGEPTCDEGADASQVRPNPAFFHRVDVLVQAGLAKDMIIDLILGSTAHNPEKMARTTTYLKYVAARYGAYPNVWITLANEYSDKYEDPQVLEMGKAMRALLPYPTPLSVHDWHGPWNHGKKGEQGVNGAWCTHSIRQGKMPKHPETSDMYLCADGMMQDYSNNQGKPTVNDENGYYGEEASAEDIAEGVLGTFVGGGYGTTGYRTRDMTQGPYYWGFAAAKTDIAAHPVVHMLRFLRQTVDQHVSFWEMTPVGRPAASIFSGGDEHFRVLQWAGRQYLLASDKAQAEIVAQLPNGEWEVVQWDVVRQKETVLGKGIRGSYRFATPDSRAAITLFTRADE